MTGFVWIDRDRRRHELDTPAPIEAEAATISQEMDSCVIMLDSPDRMIRDPARSAAGRLGSRLERLRADLVRWNDHAVALTRAEAAKLAGQIDRLPITIADVALVVALHDEHNRMIDVTAGAPNTRADVLAGPATALQRRAIEADGSRTAPIDPTRAEAKAWLDHQPRFARSGAVDGGWFAWIDRREHAHRLSDPLLIEREVVAIAGELAALGASLVGTADAHTLYAAVISGFASYERLQILEKDMERFDREATACEDIAWTTYAADWRAKRMK